MPEGVLREPGTARKPFGHHPSTLEGLALHADVGRSRPDVGVAQRLNNRPGGLRLLSQPLASFLSRAPAETAPYGSGQRYSGHAAEDPAVLREPIRHA